MGSGDYPLARQFAASSLYLIGGISLGLVVLTYPFLGNLLFIARGAG